MEEMTCQHRRRWILAALFPLLILGSNTCRHELENSKVQEQIMGRWQGFAQIHEGDFHSFAVFDLEFTLDDNGNVQGRWLDRSEALNYLLEKLVIQGNGFEAEIGPRRNHLTANLKANGTRLTVALREDDEVISVVLQRNYPGFGKYRTARTDSDGLPQTTYQYRAPNAAIDGWEVSTIAAERLSEQPIIEMLEAILRNEYHLIDSVLVARNGKLVLEEYFYGYNQNSPHQISSATKSLSAMITGTAVDRGLISLDDLIYPLFSGYDSKQWIAEQFPITLHHVLAMTSGLDWDEESYPYKDSRNSAGQMLQTEDWTDFLLDVPLRDAPGERYVYNSGTSGMLGHIIKNATDLDFDELAHDYLFSPLGISNYKWATQPDGSPRSAGGFQMLPRDMLKLGQLVLDGGHRHGEQILSESWIESMISRQTAEGDYAYGYLWHLLPAAGGGAIEVPIDMVLAVGQGGQIIAIVSDLELVAVLTSGNFEARPPHPLIAFLKHILPAVIGE